MASFGGIPWAETQTLLRQRQANGRGMGWLDRLQSQYAAAAAAAVPPPPPPATTSVPLATTVHLTPRLRAIRFPASREMQKAFLRTQPRSELYAHQEEAVAFMAMRETAEGGRGGILADDMRLGKTLSVYAFLLRDLQRRVQEGEDRFGRPTLIVMPKILLRVWQNELDKHFGTGSACPLHVVALDERTYDAHVLTRDTDLVLATYPMILSASLRKTLRAVQWRRIVADEAHVIAATSGRQRPRHSKCFHQLCALAADYRWFLSATPLQNSANDLGAALRFVGIPPAIAFGPPTAPAFRDAVQRVLLRRRWSDLQDCPRQGMMEAGAHLVRLHFATPAEKALYTALVAQAQAQAQAPVATHRHVIRLVTQLRQACICPRLIRHLQLPPTLAWGDDAVDDRNILRLPTVFTKERWLLDYVRAHGGEKVVVYSSYKKVLQRVQTLLEAQAPHTTVLVDGQQCNETRHAALTAFETDAHVTCLLITKGTGKHGLTFTCAHHVVLLDLWWNPTVDDQAVARLFDARTLRGERTVHVHVLTMIDTIDEYVAQVANDKRALDALLPVDRAIHLHHRREDGHGTPRPGDTPYAHALRFLHSFAHA